MEGGGEAGGIAKCRCRDFVGTDRQGAGGGDSRFGADAVSSCWARGAGRSSVRSMAAVSALETDLRGWGVLQDVWDTCRGWQGQEKKAVSWGPMAQGRWPLAGRKIPRRVAVIAA